MMVRTTKIRLICNTMVFSFNGSHFEDISYGILKKDKTNLSGKLGLSGTIWLALGNKACQRIKQSLRTAPLECAVTFTSHTTPKKKEQKGQNINTHTHAP